MNHLWLMHPDTLRDLRERRAVLGPADPEQHRLFAAAQVEARVEAQAARKLPRGLSLAGDTADLRVEGILVEQLSFWLWLLGYEQTVYADIQAGIDEVLVNPEVKNVRFLVNSVGGTASGLFETLAALERLREAKTKRVTVHAKNAYSAAYGIAAAAGPITAQTVGSMFGSVGVAVDYLLEEDIVELTNTDSPDKRPDVTTEEGRAVVVRELDAVFELFADAIARGRGTTVEDVRKNFGRGASFVAAEAKRRGMIDTAPGQLRAVSGKTASAVETTSAARGARKDKQMDLRELRAQHPDVYDEAVQAGVRQERDRVCAHLELGVQAGALETAHAAIRDGSEMTQTLTAKYLAAGMNKRDRELRQSETDAAAKTLDGAAAKPAGEPEDLTDRIADAMFGPKKGK